MHIHTDAHLCINIYTYIWGRSNSAEGPLCTSVHACVSRMYMHM